MLEEAAAAESAQAGGGRPAERPPAGRGGAKAAGGASPEARTGGDSGGAPASPGGGAAGDRGDGVGASMESDGAGGGAGRGLSADRMQGQIERLTDALVGTDARSARRGALRSPLALRPLRSPRRPSLCFRCILQ